MSGRSVPPPRTRGVEELEKRLLPYCEPRLHCLPRLYRSFITRYRFVRFAIAPILFFTNTGQHGFYELADRIFADKCMSPVLLEQGLLQFGTPSTGSYDPICFATRRMIIGDAPIVQIDHEDILSFNGEGSVVREIAPSFRNFVERVVAGEVKVGLSLA